MNRAPNNCFDCDHVINTVTDRYGDPKIIREASKWTCVAFPRQGIIGVVDGSYVLPDPYVQCWKIRQLCPESCPVYRKRLPGQKHLNLEEQEA